AGPAAGGGGGGVGGGVFASPPRGAGGAGGAPRPPPPPAPAGPVEQVVPAPGLFAGRPVGDLIPGHAVGAENLIGDQVAVGHRVVVGGRHVPPADPRRQRGTLLDDQRVGGDVVGAGRQGRRQRLPPVGVALARGAVDQVQADVREPGLARPPRAPRRPAGLVHAVQ